ncbi:MAG TPA: isochorismatase family cysteine hydrolase [Bryobacteraceae bacterium]|nr:isochorismatase family cysteine hydrolase [Bryobacteraceae bacterium]
MKPVFFDVFFDVDTQLDFLYPVGALYVPGAESIVAQVAALNQWAAGHGIPVVSTVDAHTENDPEFRAWPPHCVAGTAGQQKPAATLLEKRTTLASGLQDFRMQDSRQILLEKQSLDCFTNPNLPALLNRLGAERCVVYGVVTEICVKNAAMGLLKSGRQVTVLTDAVRSLDPTGCERFFQEFAAGGGKIATAQAILV